MNPIVEFVKIHLKEVQENGDLFLISFNQEQTLHVSHVSKCGDESRVYVGVTYHSYEMPVTVGRCYG